MNEYERGFIDLAGAILNLAADDYIKALKRNDAKKIKVLERFFLSDWGQLLSFEHGAYIIERCRKIAAQENCDDMKQND